MTLTNPAIALHILTRCCSFRRFDWNVWNGLIPIWNGAKRLNDWNVWNGLIPVVNGAKRLNDWNVWNGSDSRDERSAAIEPFDRTQGKLLERLERLELVPAWVSDVPNVAG